MITFWGCLSRGRCYLIPARDVLVVMPDGRARGGMLFCHITLRAQAQFCRAASSLPFGGKGQLNSQLSPPQVMLENRPKWAWFKKQHEVAAVHKPQSPAGGFGALRASLLLGERLENLRVILFLMLNAWFPSSATSWWRFWSRAVFSPNTSRILQAKACLLKAACAHVCSPAGC